MRCPKCGYISFDYNQLCPKCNKDISDEQAKINLPTYKHNPPSLLGMLIGGEEESSAGFTLDNASNLQRAGVDLDLEEPASMKDNDAIDLSGADNELEISLSDDSGEFELPEIDLDDQSQDIGDIELGSGGEKLSLNMDEVSFEDSDDAAASSEADSDNELDLDLDKVTGEENEKYSTVELNVSDLKVNETGELEISSLPDDIVTPGNIPEEDEIEIDQIDLDSTGDLEIENNSTASLELSDLTVDDSDELGEADTVERIVSKDRRADDEVSLDLGDLALEEDDASLKDDESLDLADLTFDDTDAAIDLDNEDTGELQLPDTTKENFKKPASDDEPPSFEMDDIEKSVYDDTDDELNLDLENLDLELDLEDSDDEK